MAISTLAEDSTSGRKQSKRRHSPRIAIAFDARAAQNSYSSSLLALLPSELLLEIHLLCASEHLPVTCKHLCSFFSLTSAHHKAQYLLARVNPQSKRWRKVKRAQSMPEALLRYPVCRDDEIALIRKMVYPYMSTIAGVELPRYLFRSLSAPGERAQRDFEFVARLLQQGIASAESNNHYGLVRAVMAEHEPMVNLLLSYGGMPRGLPMEVAIQKGHVAIFAILYMQLTRLAQSSIGPYEEQTFNADKTEWLRTAAQEGQWEVFDYLRGKGATPDGATLKILAAQQGLLRGNKSKAKRRQRSTK